LALGAFFRAICGNRMILPRALFRLRIFRAKLHE
jgi:hypothetical protein